MSKETEKVITSPALDNGGKAPPAKAPAADGIPKDGVVVSPTEMAQAIMDGQKTMFVKPRALKLDGRKFVLLHRRLAFGVVEFGDPVKMDQQELLKRKSEHLIDQQTLKEWCGIQPMWCKGPYWGWPVKVLIRFSQPRETNVPQGPQVLAHDVVVKSEVRIENIQDPDTYDPSKVRDAVLRDDFRIVLAWYASWKKDPDGFKHGLPVIQKLLRAILKEAVRRGPEVITFNPRGMAPTVRAFFLDTARQIGLPQHMLKRLALQPATEPKDMSVGDLLAAHWELHGMYDREAHSQGSVKGFSLEDVVNLHSRVVDELFERGTKHPPPPDTGLDQTSSEFESHSGEQPDWYTGPDRSVKKGEYADINRSGVKRGPVLKIKDVLPHFKSFKIRKPYVYLVGGLANHGETDGDIDILVKDSESLPDDFKHVIHFRLGRALPAEVAERLQIHYDNFHGPFTKFVELYDLKFERINIQDEVVEMRDAEIEKRFAKPFRSPGGKDAWAKWLVAQIPEHEIYVEPHAGSASVLFEKEPSAQEVIADVDAEIINLYKFLKHGSEADFEWMRGQDWSWSESKFNQLKGSKSGSQKQRAYRFKYMNLHSARGAMEHLDRSDASRNRKEPGRIFLANLEKFKERLANVEILSTDALEVMKKYDSASTFFYLDPPWKPVGSGEPWHDFDEDAFVDAAKALNGKALISYQGKIDLGSGWSTRNKSVEQGGFTGVSHQQLYQNYTKTFKQNAVADAIGVGEFFPQPKPTRPAFPGERQTVERLVALYRDNPDWLPAYVQKKYDGVNTQVHRDGDEVKIWTEDGEDVTVRLPGLIDEVKKLKPKQLVMAMEVETWDGQQHMPREVTAGYLSSKREPDDSSIVGNVYDVIYADKLLNELSTEDRLTALAKIGIKQSTMSAPNLKYRLNAAPSVEVSDLDQLERAVRRIRALPGSEGVVIKQVGAPYPIGKVTPDTWIKFHNSSEVRGVVISRVPVKDAPETWVYQYGVMPGRENPAKTVDVDNKRIVPVGDSFNTKMDLDKGDVIVIEGETVNLIRTPNGVEMTVWVPRVIDEIGAKPDTVDAATSRARRNLVLQEKDIDEQGAVTYRTTRKVEKGRTTAQLLIEADDVVLDIEERYAELAKQADPYLEVPDEAGNYRYTVQHHWRGRGMHADFRIELRPKKLLAGWTLNTQIAGAVKEPVTTLTQAQSIAKNKMDEISKINWNTGEWAMRRKRGATKPVRVEILSQPKAPEPWAWLDVEGKTREPKPGEAPPVGGTRRYPGVFDIVDKGVVEYGAQKPWTHEYFVHGSAMNYRLFFRQLRLNKSIEKSEYTDGTHVCVVVKLPDSIADRFPDSARAKDNMPHVTAVYIGDLPKEQVGTFMKAVLDTAAETKPIDVKLADKVSYFNPTKNSGKKRVAKLAVESDGLKKFHAALKRRLESGGVELPGDFSYHPHATLSYLEPGVDYDDVVPSGSWKASSIEVWGFDQWIELPLGIRKFRHSYSRCMAKDCKKPPEVDVLWAEGKARAWFCKKHFEEWKSKEVNLGDGIDCTYKELMSDTKVIRGGNAPKRWSDVHKAAIAKSILPPSEPEAGAYGTATWLCIRPDDQRPNVLDQDTVDDGWMPPIGYSALPKAVRRQVPDGYRYWLQKKADAAKNMRDALVQAIKDGEVDLDFAAPYKRSMQKLSPLDARFVLQEQTWRGPIQIRVGPSRSLWWLRLDVGRPELVAIKMYRSPIDNERLSAEVEQDRHKDSMTLDGPLVPGHYLNPTKDTPSNLSIIDSGKAEVMSLSDTYIKVRLDGKRLKGLFGVTKRDGEWAWAPTEAGPEIKKAEGAAVEDGKSQSTVMPIVKVEREKRLVTGVVLEPGVVDAHGDVIGEEAIERACHNFLARYNEDTKLGFMHKVFGSIGVDLVECWLAPTAFELNGTNIKAGTWLITVKIHNDQLWKRVKSGEYTGFSIGGVATVAGS